MTETPAEETTRVCGFPGCDEPAAAPSAATGRPPEYCANPAHTALEAWREKRRREQRGEPESEDMGRPVSMAAARGGALRDELLRTAETLSSQLDRVVGELRTLSDPDAAAAQIETVTTETARQVAEAEARASRATAA